MCPEQDLDGLAYITVGSAAQNAFQKCWKRNERFRRSLLHQVLETKGRRLFQAVFKDVPKTLYMANHEVLMESSKCALPRQQELLFLNTRKMFPDRLGKEIPTAQKIVHVFMGQFLGSECSCESIMKPQSAIDEIDIRKGFVAAVWAVAWILLPIKVFPVMWSERLPDLQELEGKTIQADEVNKFSTFWLPASMNNSGVEQAKRQKWRNLALPCPARVCVGCFCEKEISTLLEFWYSYDRCNLKDDESKMCRNLKILRLTWQQHGQGASRNQGTAERLLRVSATKRLLRNCSKKM